MIYNVFGWTLSLTQSGDRLLRPVVWHLYHVYSLAFPLLPTFQPLLAKLRRSSCGCPVRELVILFLLFLLLMTTIIIIIVARNSWSLFVRLCLIKQFMLLLFSLSVVICSLL